MPYVRIWISEEERHLLHDDAVAYAHWIDALQHKTRTGFVIRMTDQESARNKHRIWEPLGRA